MREVLNVSFSPALALEVKKAVKSGHFASQSEFFRELFKMWKSEELLFQEVKKSMKEFRQGKGKVLKSFADLD